MRYLFETIIRTSIVVLILSGCLISMYYYADTSFCWFYYSTDLQHTLWWEYYTATLSCFFLIIGGSSCIVLYMCLLYALYQKVTKRQWIVDYYQPLGWVILFGVSAVVQRMYSMSLFETRCYGGITGAFGYQFLLILKDPLIVQSAIGLLFFVGFALSTDVLLIICAQRLHTLYTAIELENFIWPTICSIISRLVVGIRKKIHKHYRYSSQPVVDAECYSIEDNELVIEESNNATHSLLKKYNIPLKNIFAGHKTLPASSADLQDMHDTAQRLEEKLKRFGIEGSVNAITPGPVITLFEYAPHINAKISRIMALEDDLALALEALSVRIIAPIPGTCLVGFEVANKTPKIVLFSEVICSDQFSNTSCSLALALGHDVKGSPIIVDLAFMPHLLIAGTTGSGKSGVLNVILMSILCKQSHKHTRLVLIDPKRLEFSVYANIPHLLFPIVTEVKKIAQVLEWVLKEMYDRYAIMEKVGVRNVIEYNQYAQRNGLSELYSIVVIIDELADIMLSIGKQVEELIVRIAQMARAASIHLVIATQRPSVDVITGLIKGNFPSRIACRVASKVDSRTILDINGAQKLLGKGDMLLLSSHEGLKRVHGAYVPITEINSLVNYLKNYGSADYVMLDQSIASHAINNGPAQEDELYDQIVTFVASCSYISILLLQRRFRIGYNRSARIVEKLEAQGIIMYDAAGKIKKVTNA